MTILLIGAQGQVGHALARSLAPLGRVVALDRRHVDLSRAGVILPWLEKYTPRVIVNAAAYTAVDKAETERDAAAALNTRLPAELAAWAARHGALLVHYSTDYVYDGQGEAPRHEDEHPAPLSVYGQTKLEGDRAIQATGCDHLIFRTSWVYAARGYNFMRTMLKLAAERDSLRVVADQVGAPTPAWLIASVTALAVGRHQQGLPVCGLYHLTAAGETSWHGFARAIVEGARANGYPLRLAVEQIQPIPTIEYPAPAPRPHNSRLSLARLEHTFGLRMPDWRSALDLTLADWLEQQPAIPSQGARHDP